MMIALHAPVHDGLVSLFANTFSCYLGVNPVRIAPHARIDLAKLDRGTCVVSYGLSERRIEVSIIQKNIGIMEPSVEMPFHRLDRLYNPIQLLISCQDHENRVRSSAMGLRFETAGHKDFVVFLADFSVSSKISDPHQ